MLQKGLAGACYNEAPVCVVLQQDTSLCYNKTPLCVRRGSAKALNPWRRRFSPQLLQRAVF